jgi:hypothetical protein
MQTTFVILWCALALFVRLLKYQACDILRKIRVVQEIFSGIDLHYVQTRSEICDCPAHHTVPNPCNVMLSESMQPH